MRALRRLARPAVATAAAVLLLSGCGDDNNDDNASSTPTTSADSSETSEDTGSSGGDGDLAAWCDQAQEFATVLQGVDPSAPETIGDTLQEASDAFDAAEPPAEIADDWEVLGDALHEWADTTSSVDITSPEGAQQVTAATQQFQEVFTGPSGDAVDEYGSANCN